MIRPGRHRIPLLLVALLAVAVLGLVAQVLKTEDPRSPLVYFTVLNALGVVVTFTAGVVPGSRRRLLPALARFTVTTGAVVAGIVYVTLIAPQEGGSTWLLTQPMALVATLALHIGVPILAVLGLRRLGDAATVRNRIKPAGAVALSLLWPLGWGALALSLDALGLVLVPYGFLDPAQVGWAGVGASQLVVLVLWTGTAAALCGRRDGGWRARPDGDAAVTSSESMTVTDSGGG